MAVRSLPFVAALAAFLLSVLAPSLRALQADPPAVGQRAAGRFAEPPLGARGLTTLDQLHGRVALLVQVDAADPATSRKLVPILGKLAEKHGERLEVIVFVPGAGAEELRHALEGRWLSHRLAVATAPPFAAGSSEGRHAWVVDPEGQVLFAGAAGLDLDEVEDVVREEVSKIESSEGYAPGSIQQVARRLREGEFAAALAELEELEKAEDPLLRRTAQVARIWWAPRTAGVLDRAERLLELSRWSEAAERLAALAEAYPGVRRAKDELADRYRTLLARAAGEGADEDELEAEEEYFELERKVWRKGPSSATRKKLAKLAEERAGTAGGKRAAELLECLGEG